MAHETEPTVLSAQDHQALIELEALATDPEDVRTLRELAGNGQKSFEVINSQGEHETHKVTEIGDIAIHFSKEGLNDIAQNAFPSPYEGRGQR